jgi:hypothetical protein
MVKIYIQLLDNINPNLEKIQLLFFSRPKFEDYSEEIGKWLDKNKTDYISTDYLNKFDSFIQTLLPNPKEYESLLIRAGLIGMLISDNEKTPDKFSVELDKLPNNIKDAAKKFNLSPTEVEAIKFTLSEGGIYISRVSDSIRNRAKEILLLKQSQRQANTKAIRRALEDEFADETGIKTDWQKVSVYETNSAFNNGYLARTGPGEWVIGISRPDACSSCKEKIDGKLFKVINPPGDYSTLDPGSKAYQRMSEIYDNCLWVGKNNIGRKKTKQVTKGGETFTRDHHELYVPALPMHPLCQCRVFRIIPEEQYLDKKNILRFRVDNKTEWEKYYNNVFKPLNEKLKTAA